MPRERERFGMVATEAMTEKVHVGGHYEVIEMPWATDYVWVSGDEEVERRLLDEVLRPWRAPYEEWEMEARAHPEERQRMEMESL
jgi:hypothetical protein